MYQIGISLLILCLLNLLFHEVNAQEFTIIKDANPPFAYDIRYATTDNFVEEVLYDCAICMLRPEVAEALKKANAYFCEKGYRIKIFDCYRPYDVQKAMWEKVPRATYVANPYDGGSVHNRGAAVDITLETLEGCYVEMGTDYDYFGREAHIDNRNFSQEILDNRALLIEGMRKHGFQTIRTEWWHYAFEKNWQYPIANEPLPCGE
ncbi:M15 family metallopeptidase [Flavobacteriaceae bacterium TK19130]|nr:M15 family metallopeptidase [Thermobacterium salinum]